MDVLKTKINEVVNGFVNRIESCSIIFTINISLLIIFIFLITF